MASFSSLLFWRKKSPKVAVVRLSGVIAAETGPLRRGLNLNQIESQLKRAFTIPSVKAVTLVINSPGGSPVQSQLIAARIRQLATRHNVPVLAFCEDVAASGGYWLAAAADEIYANSASVIGSIGVISSGFGFPEALKRLGVERRVYTSGLSKSMLDPFSEEKDSDVAHLSALQSDIHQLFIDYVKSRRGTRLSGADEELFSGKFWTGNQAKSFGLVDGVGLFHDVLESRFGADIKIITLSQRTSWRSVTARLGSRLPSGFAAQLIDDGMAQAEERAHWSRFGL